MSRPPFLATTPDPFEALGLTPEAAPGDAEVRGAYLRAVRSHPPERDPERFKQIRAAYEQLQTEEGRLQAELFQLRAPPLPQLEAAEPLQRVELTDEEIVLGLIQAHFLAGRRLLGSLRPDRPEEED